MKRNSLSEQEREEYSALICEKLLPYLKDRTVFSYYPSGSEVDVSLINRLCDVAYPVIKPDGEMDAYRSKGKMVVNRLGIMEPDPSLSEKIAKDDIDVIIVPCVGFNEKADRLGHGGGYYDRYLQDAGAFKISVAYEIQKTDGDFREDHDISVDLVITEKNTYKKEG